MDGTIYALNKYSGKLLWKVNTENWIISSPAYFEGTIIIGTRDKRILAIDINTGNIKWEIYTLAPIHATPAIYKCNVYIGDLRGNFYSIRAYDGTICWSIKINSPIFSSAAVNDKIVAFGSKYKGLILLNPENGFIIKSNTFRLCNSCFTIVI